MPELIKIIQNGVLLVAATLMLAVLLIMVLNTWDRVKRLVRTYRPALTSKWYEEL